MLVTESEFYWHQSEPSGDRYTAPEMEVKIKSHQNGDKRVMK